MPSAQIIQKGLYVNNKSSVYLFAGEAASHRGVAPAVYTLLTEQAITAYMS